MRFKKILILLGFVLLKLVAIAQTDIGNQSLTKLSVFEYYNHTTPEWIKLFRIKNYDNTMGFWGKGGATGRLYFVDYQGNGGSYIDFSFPQSINSNLKPILILNGASADKIEWYAFSGNDGPGQNYYDVYIKTPEYHLGLTFLIRGGDYKPYFTADSQPATQAIWNYQLSPQSFNYYSGNGNVGIGTITPKEKLSVNGNIRAKEVKVEATGWPDYVFAKNYVLPTLAETEKYIKEKGYLPGMPSAMEVESNGLAMSEMFKLQQKKIEELTIYLIDKEKQINNQKSKIEMLEKDFKDLKRMLNEYLGEK
ncbi:hypothetical protein [Pedobacter nototheniae]|uniref:hypothetical protein n=1 Tax=Pedobacter nototheniae TaxID=2488994 RepID=UPI00103CD5A7|nr:hypothetical protein [Pedobacter nototheniae]